MFPTCSTISVSFMASFPLMALIVLNEVCPEQREAKLVRTFSYARCHGFRAQLREITFAGERMRQKADLVCTPRNIQTSVHTLVHTCMSAFVCKQIYSCCVCTKLGFWCDSMHLLLTITSCCLRKISLCPCQDG